MKNLAASVRARLLNRSRERNESLDSLMEHYAMGRFLYRLDTPGLSEVITRLAEFFLPLLSNECRGQTWLPELGWTVGTT